MSSDYTLIPALASAVEMPEEGILSKPVSSDSHLRATLFAMTAGQEMTQHTTTMEAVLQFLEGKAVLTLGEDRHEVQAGAWVRMAPNLPHGITAATDLKMLLIVLRDSRDAPAEQ